MKKRKISKKFIKIAVIVLVCICLFDVVLSGVISVPKEYRNISVSFLTPDLDWCSRPSDVILKYGLPEDVRMLNSATGENDFTYNFTYGETYCVNKSLTKRDTSGKIYSCQYIRDEILSENNLIEDQAKIISSKFPKCKNCQVYDMCGAACIKSVSHDMECFFYKNLYSWFKQYYSENKEIFEHLRRLKIYEY